MFKNSKGISLLEIMVSILFFSLIALSLSHTLTASLTLTAHDNNIVKANNLAKLYLEDVAKAWKNTDGL